MIGVCSYIGVPAVQKLPFNSQFENTKISLNNIKMCKLRLKRTDNSCILLRDTFLFGNIR